MGCCSKIGPVLTLGFFLLAGAFPAAAQIGSDEVPDAVDLKAEPANPESSPVVDPDPADAAEGADTDAPPMTEEEAEPYLGFYRYTSKKVIVEVLLQSGRLAVDVPSLGVFELDPPGTAPPESAEDSEDEPSMDDAEEDEGEGEDEVDEFADVRWMVRGVKDFSVVFNPPEGETREDAEEMASLTLFQPNGSAEEMARDPDLITFDIQVDGPNGPAKVKGAAGSFEFQPDDYLIATDTVRLRYDSLELNAKTLRIDIPERRATAEGDVLFIDGRQYLSGDSLDLDLDSRTGTLTNATARVEPEFFFSGRTISKVGDLVYTIEDGELTSCTEDVPAWSFALTRARVTLGEYAHIKNARFRLKKVPVIWVPRMIWPATVERSSGFLIPQPTFSERRGAGLGIAYYQTLGRSADTTFYAEATTDEFFEIGNKTRYRPSEGTEGVLEFLFQNEPDRDPNILFPDDPDRAALLGVPEEERWKVSLKQTTEDVFGGFRAVIDYEDYSDPVYRLDNERNADRQTNNFIHSTAYLTKNWGRHSLNLLIDQRERINVRPDVLDNEDDPVRAGVVTDIRKNLPEVEYRLRSTQLGKAPIYLDLEANAHFLSFERVNARVRGVNPNRQHTQINDKDEYFRFDIFPNFSIPLSTIPWFSAKLDLGGRATYYSNSINPNTALFNGTTPVDLVGDSGVDFEPSETQSIDRTRAISEVEIVGPSFSRIFDRTETTKKKKGRFAKFKHIIEPRWSYRRQDEIGANDDELMDDPGSDVIPEGEVPLFDELDIFRDTNSITFSFINRLLAKPRNEEEGGGFEIASFELAQSFSLDDDLPLQIAQGATDRELDKNESPIRGIFRYNPTQETSFKLEARYNTLFSAVQAVSLSGGTKVGRHTFGGSWSVQRRLAFDESTDDMGQVVRELIDETSGNQLRVFTSLALTDRLKFDANVSLDLDLPADSERSNPIQQRYFISYQACCYDLKFELRESTFGNITDRDFRFSFSLKNVGSFIDLNGSF